MLQYKEKSAVKAEDKPVKRGNARAETSAPVQTKSFFAPVPAEPAASARTRGAVIQRAPAPASDANLARIYNHMLTASATFRKLDQAVSPAGHQLTLADSSLTGGYETDYNMNTHVIRAPCTSPPPAAAPRGDDALADDLLWEMHNAKNQQGFLDTNQDLGRVAGAPAMPALTTTPPNPVVDAELYNACFALSYEWLEWINILEQVVRGEKINREAGAGTVDVGFKPAFVNAAGAYDYGNRWFKFENYLRSQLATHTIHYDALANTPAWRGRFLLEKALLRQPDRFVINDARAMGFGVGAALIVNPANNMFKTAFLQDLAGRFAALPAFH